MTRDATVASIRESMRWQRIAVFEVKLRELSAGATLLTYRAEASRALDEPVYPSPATSVYEDAGGQLKLLHEAPSRRVPGQRSVPPTERDTPCWSHSPISAA